MTKTLLFSAAFVLGAAFTANADLPQVYTLSVPATTNAYLNDTFEGGGEYYGMGNIQWNVHVDGLQINTESTEVVSIYYNGTLLKTLSPADEGAINITSISAGALTDEGDDNGSGDLFDPIVSKTVDFNFGAQSAEGTANKPDPEFLKSGEYRLVVPAGIFQQVIGENDPVDLPAGEVTYVFTAEMQATNVYYFIPAEGSHVGADGLKSIQIVFPGTKNVNNLDYPGNGKGTLTAPNGTAQKGGTYPTVNRGDLPGFTWNFKSSANVWSDGAYTLTVAPNVLSIDGVIYDKEIVAVFYIGEESTPDLPEETPAWNDIVFDYPESDSSSTSYDDNLEIVVINTTVASGVASATINVTIPEDYNKCWVAEELSVSPLAITRATAEWVPAEEILTAMKEGGYDFVETTAINVPADNTDHTYHVLFGVDDQVNVNAKTTLMAKVSTNTAVGSIDVDTAKAEYYNLQGVKVANPENGIFVKVVGGKAVKVVR
ncbi:MAG: hypothetical protein NC328_06520 [Muribaculum sp.]|nr:hypothetical protein [Muribaculum sp.]